MGQMSIPLELIELPSEAISFWIAVANQSTGTEEEIRAKAWDAVLKRFGTVINGKWIESKTKEKLLILRSKGSARSGNYAHRGRPGKVGGSMPKSNAPVTGAPAFTLPTNLAHFGDSIKITPGTDMKDMYVQKHLEQLAMFSKPLIKKLIAKGVGWEVSDKPITEMDDNQFLKGVVPRGWISGYTWDDCNGGYNPGNNTVFLGHAKQGDFAGLALHETGHAIGSMFRADTSDKMVAFHKEMYAKLSPYRQQDGPGGKAGMEETFAEGVKGLVQSKSSKWEANDRVRLEHNYNVDFIAWIEKGLQRGDFTTS